MVPESTHKAQAGQTGQANFACGQRCNLK
ncbi:hypothetical protein D918_03893 [Trichuris suis]|nr:hypothetical protein D918_03893 [Trichuris suis]